MELEENNLSLIQQWQENEQQTETRRQEYEKVKKEKNDLINGLQITMSENQMRSTKIKNEKSILEAQTSKGSEGVMSNHVYEQVKDKISHIRQLCDKKRAKGSNQPDPVTQLIEIETHINRVRNFIELAKKVDRMNDEDVVKEKMRVLYNKRKDEKFNAIQIEKKRLQEENAKKL